MGAPISNGSRCCRRRRAFDPCAVVGTATAAAVNWSFYRCEFLFRLVSTHGYCSFGFCTAANVLAANVRAATQWVNKSAGVIAPATKCHLFDEGELY